MGGGVRREVTKFLILKTTTTVVVRARVRVRAEVKVTRVGLKIVT